MGGQGDPRGIVQEIEFWAYEQMAYTQPRICPWELNEKTPLRFWDTNESPNLSQTTKYYNNQQKRELAEFWTLFPGEPQKEIARMWRGISILLGIEKNTTKHETVDYTNCIWCCWYSHQRSGQTSGRLGKNRTGGDCPNLLSIAGSVRILRII